MAFWDIYSSNSVWVMNIFRALILIFAIFEIYMYTRKKEDLEELISWRSKPLQEARGNLLMIGLFIITFGVIIYLDTYSDHKFIYIPIDIALLVLIGSLYFLPKKAIISKSGVYYGGAFSPKEKVVDYTVHDRFDKLVVKGPRSLFSSNMEIPLPDDRTAMVKALEQMMGNAPEAKKGRKEKKGRPERPGKGQGPKAKESGGKRKNKASKEGKPAKK